MTQVAQVLAKDAKQKSAAELQTVLVDLIDLGLQGKQAHWNVVGPQFRTLHLELDEVVEDSRKWADEVAERLRALGVAADGRASVIAKYTGIESLPEGTITDKEMLIRVTDQLAAVAARGRASIDRLDGADKVSEDILIEVVEGLEMHLWMFRSQQALRSQQLSGRSSAGPDLCALRTEGFPFERSQSAHRGLKSFI